MERPTALVSLLTTRLCQASAVTGILSFVYSTQPSCPTVNRPPSYVTRAQPLNARPRNCAPKEELHPHPPPCRSGPQCHPILLPVGNTTQLHYHSGGDKVSEIPTSPHPLGHVTTYLNMLTLKNCPPRRRPSHTEVTIRPN